MYPYNIYILDFSLRVMYLLFSYLFCSVIFFQYNETIILFETTSVIFTLDQKRFIATQLTQIFNTVWFLCTALSFIFIFPLTTYNIKLFFASGWYKYQVHFYNQIFITFTIFFYLNHFFCQLVLIPQLASFFLYWEIIDEYSLLKVEAEISLLFYIKWAFALKFLIAFVWSLGYTVIVLLIYFLDSKRLYSSVLTQKRKTLFVLLTLFTFLVPPDFSVQILATLSLFLTTECFSFFLCLKLLFKNS